MMKATVAGGALVTTLALLALAAGRQAPDDVHRAVPTSPVVAPSTLDAHDGLLYGRVSTDDGTVYEGRLRFGADEEALWGNYFNGFKKANPWVAHAPPERLPKERHALQVFQIEIAVEWRADLGRPFMARFGDIARIEPHGRDLRVTLKSGTLVHLDRWGADDFADGVRIWDASHGVVDLRERQIHSIEFLPTAPLGPSPTPLYGTVRTRQGDFTGFIQWDREACVGSDDLVGNTDDGAVVVRFATIRSIARRSRESALVTLRDGRETLLSGTRAVGSGSRGIYVDDPRYGRVLISWDAFERVDFGPGGTGPAYDDFPAGRPLMGQVITRSGRRLAGRLVYDLDESETTETLDAPLGGVDYTIPFRLIASIEPNGLPAGGGQATARVILRDGEELQLEAAGDLGEGNAGMLVFVDGLQRAEYVPWTDVAQVTLAPPPAM